MKKENVYRWKENVKFLSSLEKSSFLIGEDEEFLIVLKDDENCEWCFVGRQTVRISKSWKSEFYRSIDTKC